MNKNIIHEFVNKIEFAILLALFIFSLCLGGFVAKNLGIIQVKLVLERKLPNL